MKPQEVRTGKPEDVEREGEKRHSISELERLECKRVNILPLLLGRGKPLTHRHFEGK